MAQVMRDPQIHAWVEDYLEYLSREWRSVPEVAREWEAWDEADRLDFVIEWPIREDRLGQLATWSEQGLLTAAQRVRYERLLGLVTRHRPILERLLREEAA